MEGSHPFYRFSKILFSTTFFLDLRGTMSQFGKTHYFVKQSRVNFRQAQKLINHYIIKVGQMKVKMWIAGLA